MTKKTKYKPSNKDRDSAISHLLGRINHLEQMVGAQMEVFDKFLKFEKKEDKFNKYLTKEMEKQIEAQRIVEENADSLAKDTKDEGRRAEGVCEE